VCFFFVSAEAADSKASSKAKKLSLTAQNKRRRQTEQPSSTSMPEVEARSRAVALAQPEPRPPVMPETPKPVTTSRPPQPRSTTVLPPPPPREPTRSPALPQQPPSHGQDVTAPLDLSFEAVLNASMGNASAGMFDIEQMVMMSLDSPEIHSDNAVGDREELINMQRHVIMDASSFPVLPKTPDLPKVGTLASSPDSVDLVTPTNKMPTSALEQAAIDAATAASLAINIPSVQPTPEPDEPRPSTSRQPVRRYLQVEVDCDDLEAMRLCSLLEKRMVKKR
jgi:hypothetical protein